MKYLIVSFLILSISMFSFGQSPVPVLFDTVSWTSHFDERTATGDIGPGNLIVVSESSDVTVARLAYSGEMIADIYYPPNSSRQDAGGAVILVSGDSDSHVMSWYGRPLKDTNQYLQWGQVLAEAGIITITYELGNPQAALEALVSWVEANSQNLGINPDKIGFFAAGENACTTGLETIVRDSRNYSGPKPAFAVYYYGMLPLRSSKEIHLDVPIMTVITRDYMYRGMPDSMEKFNRRAEGDGALLSAYSYPEGVHWFDCKEDLPKSRELVEETIRFMVDNLQDR